MKVFPRLLLSSLILLSAALCHGQETKRNDRPQQPGANPQRREANKKAPDPTRYRYEFTQPQFRESHIVIEHDALGRGKIKFERRGEAEAIDEPIELSTAALGRIFGLWSGLRFLDSSEKYQASRSFANLGTHKLGMDDGKRQRTAEFNWSNNANAWTLAQEYRRVADQAIFVFDMSVARENQPLNTPGLLNQLESLYTRNSLSDPTQLVPLLKELRTDEHIPLIARNHAERLLKKIEK